MLRPYTNTTPRWRKSTMDTFRLIKFMRSVREFTDQVIPDDTLMRILQAGRWSGSPPWRLRRPKAAGQGSKNTQPRHFIVVKNREMLSRLADCGTYANHLRGAAIGIAVVLEHTRVADFDAGRCVQNMCLAAWAEGIGSCIGSMHHEEDAKKVLGVPEHLSFPLALSFGYPQKPREELIERKPQARVLASLARKPLAEIVHYEKW
jgi:nitroreductase